MSHLWAFAGFASYSVLRSGISKEITFVHLSLFLILRLWPEPYQDTVCNAHVKDQLEDRLHRMVCRGHVDLATAQRDISTDWIAAYRKYFHADSPVSDNSSANFPSFGRSIPRT
jgi:hypothetical protein